MCRTQDTHSLHEVLCWFNTIGQFLSCENGDNQLMASQRPLSQQLGSWLVLARARGNGVLCDSKGCQAARMPRFIRTMRSAGV